MWSSFENGESHVQQGHRAYELIVDLYPLCRSITGDGLRDTLKLIAAQIPLEIFEVPTGKQVFDWVVPREWKIRSAYIIGPDGQRYADFSSHNLHVASYSAPVDRYLDRAELLKHIHSLPDQPDLIPYRTTYYNEDWAFCLPHRVVQSMPEGLYRAVIDSDLFNGSLSYGHTFIRGKSEHTFLLYTHVCHPSMCNDNLSGIGVAVELARSIARQQGSLNFSYLVVFAPATIGSITWISHNRERLKSIRAGLVLALAGDSGKLHYKKSRSGQSEVDRLATHVLAKSGKPYEVLEFDPYGYDERQFCSPGINLPVGRLTRTPNGAFPEYHTSADNLQFVKVEQLSDTIDTCLDILSAFDNNKYLRNTQPFCEPQLGRRGLYHMVGGFQGIESQMKALLWLLNQADGKQSLLDIAWRTGIDFKELQAGAAVLHKAGLLDVIG
jgi:aminopeptidase-like protein